MITINHYIKYLINLFHLIRIDDSEIEFIFLNFLTSNNIISQPGVKLQ